MAHGGGGGGGGVISEIEPEPIIKSLVGAGHGGDSAREEIGGFRRIGEKIVKFIGAGVEADDFIAIITKEASAGGGGALVELFDIESLALVVGLVGEDGFEAFGIEGDGGGKRNAGDFQHGAEEIDHMHQ